MYVAPRSEFDDVFNRIFDRSHEGGVSHLTHDKDPMEELEAFLDIEV